MQINFTAIIITAIICYTLYKMSKDKAEPERKDAAAGEEERKGNISQWKKK